mmetsp:Transcript_15706/g.37190  ORF Transcript_15706/g.37190 Transcript_15706/m.37190 type:complete len:203 (-) Transcript_15706:305-913(-)
MLGDLPPSSTVTGIRLSAASRSTAVPVGVEPVKAIFAMPLLCASAAPASDPYPVTTLSTPAGTVSLMSSMSAMIEVGVCSAGLSTTQFPAARAGATFHAAMTSGKFHGMIWPTTPSGSWMLIETVLMSISEAAPSSARITPAKYRKWSMTRGRSAAIDSRTALPLSTVSILASRSAFASMMSAILSNTFERSVTDALDQVDL